VCSFAITLFLPVRSSLYALLPSIGTALAAATVASRAIRMAPGRFSRVAPALVTLAVLCIPVYHLRNARGVRDADLSARALDLISMEARARTSGGEVALIDNSAAPARLEAAFGALLPDALALAVGPAWSGAIWPDRGAAPPSATLIIELDEDGALRVTKR
jgi:hypothetical protein